MYISDENGKNAENFCAFGFYVYFCRQNGAEPLWYKQPCACQVFEQQRQQEHNNIIYKV